MYQHLPASNQQDFYNTNKSTVYAETSRPVRVANTTSLDPRDIRASNAVAPRDVRTPATASNSLDPRDIRARNLLNSVQDPYLRNQAASIPQSKSALIVYSIVFDSEILGQPQLNDYSTVARKGYGVSDVSSPIVFVGIIDLIAFVGFSLMKPV
jgi:hypothetical protein